jgi:hypothetical protein
MKRTDYRTDLDVDARIILKCIREIGVKILTGLN